MTIYLYRIFADLFFDKNFQNLLFQIRLIRKILYLVSVLYHPKYKKKQSRTFETLEKKLLGSEIKSQQG